MTAGAAESRMAEGRMTETAAQLRRVAVIGAGTMGRGIAQVAALGGFETMLFDVDEGVLKQAQQSIVGALQKGVDLGKVPASAAEAARTHLRTTSRLEDAARGIDLAIEAVPEEIGLKIETFRALDRLAPPHAVLATNTSALSITELAGATDRPERVIGMHFFNPVHLMRLLEVVRALQTSDETRAIAFAAARRMGKGRPSCAAAWSSIRTTGGRATTSSACCATRSAPISKTTRGRAPRGRSAPQS